MCASSLREIGRISSASSLRRTLSGPMEGRSSDGWAQHPFPGGELVSETDTCVFCRIARGGIPATIVYQGDGVTAFRDISPQAPVHVLVIPEEHISGAGAVTDAH